MIPLRLTAVAAHMAVTVWIFADTQAVPVNYARMTIADDELVFYGGRGGNNYRVMGRITEYAGLLVYHPLLLDLSSRHAYVTRLSEYD